MTFQLGWDSGVSIHLNGPMFIADCERTLVILLGLSVASAIVFLILLYFILASGISQSTPVNAPLELTSKSIPRDFLIDLSTLKKLLGTLLVNGQ